MPPAPSRPGLEEEVGAPFQHGQIFGVGLQATQRDELLRHYCGNNVVRARYQHDRHINLGKAFRTVRAPPPDGMGSDNGF